ncbi:hypothetical protein FQA39_LY13151 [Lamprigera yunnana]|nr:hypothetical protein FQA39_LY13151 [Lamprigera yunnana]
MVKKNKLPARWEQYSPMGEVVQGTRFIPFKTPLKKDLCSKYFADREQWFTPEILQSMLPNLKLVIDLTFTDRYYSKDEFLNHDIQHVKIKCPGGGGKKIPKYSLVTMFNEVVNEFRNSKAGQNEENLIGVHCTHGLNRTGYFICNYMVTYNGFTPNDAFEAFETARGYKIERTFYKCDILKRFHKSLVVEDSITNHVGRKSSRRRRNKKRTTSFGRSFSSKREPLTSEVTSTSRFRRRPRSKHIQQI